MYKDIAGMLRLQRKRSRMPSAKQTRRIAAWIYAVVNPLIDSLEREPLLLESGNITWRFYLGRCEMLKEIQESIDSNQWPNYQTFRAEYPKSLMVHGFDRHDLDLENLNSVAQELSDYLTSSSEFLQVAESEVQAYVHERETAGSQAGWPPEYIRKELVRFSSEYVINNIQELPSHYATSDFWNFSGKKLLVFRSRPEFRPLQQAATTLAADSAKLRQVLLAFRLSKSREYDVPAAPVPGLPLED